ncbi:IS200/IS605 family transposase [Algoriphagus sp. C2-6-M1]|uniref:IS200/IS605 family transposase n=1 Tax=Algoriphagus persicinus TaxID=3108754 RepID=UPI002B3EB063|nr:IS200/IS605 family transposase [Algoriphagus sp. C2-6-M1]MEB2782838.1 IS200/IS605 family transposase [Algoriphagus sp. C2-6-M1]
MPDSEEKTIKGVIKEMVEEDIRRHCDWKGCIFDEVNLQEDHVHLLVDASEDIHIQIDGNIERENSHHAVQELPTTEAASILGHKFWARGYFVNTVGLDEEMIKRYVKYQEKEERKEEGHQQGFDF